MNHCENSSIQTELSLLDIAAVYLHDPSAVHSERFHFYKICGFLIVSLLIGFDSV